MHWKIPEECYFSRNRRVCITVLIDLSAIYVNEKSLSDEFILYFPTRSYLGPEFVHEALLADKIGEASAKGR